MQLAMAASSAALLENQTTPMPGLLPRSAAARRRREHAAGAFVPAAGAFVPAAARVQPGGRLQVAVRFLQAGAQTQTQPLWPAAVLAAVDRLAERQPRALRQGQVLRQVPQSWGRPRGRGPPPRRLPPRGPP